MASGDLLTYSITGSSTATQSLTVTPPVGKVYKVITLFLFRETRDGAQETSVGVKRSGNHTVFLFCDTRRSAAESYDKSLVLGKGGMFSDLKGHEHSPEIVLTDEDTLEIHLEDSDYGDPYAAAVTMIEL